MQADNAALMPEEMQIAAWNLTSLRVGQSFRFQRHVTMDDIDRFAALSGDASPIHVSDSAAESRGFAGRVAHGMLLGAMLSRIVGMHLPGRNALLQRMDLTFAAPTYAGTLVEFAGEVSQISEAVRTVALRLSATDAATGRMLVRGTALVGMIADE